MSNEETVQKIIDRIIDVMDSYDYFDTGFIVSDIIDQIVTEFDERNDTVVGVLEELSYINDLASEENFVEIGNRLECLKEILIKGDVPKVITNKTLVSKKAISIMQNTTKRNELNNIIRDTLKKDGERERVETFKRHLVCLCEKFNFSLKHEDAEGCLVIHNGFNSEVMRRLLKDTYYER